MRRKVKEKLQKKKRMKFPKPLSPGNGNVWVQTLKSRMDTFKKLDL